MKFILPVILLFILSITAYCGDYGVYSPSNYRLEEEPEEKILFIVDFSNSMRENLNGVAKVDLMKNTMARILSDLNPNVSAGLRIYGHRSGFSPSDACKASMLAAPIRTNNGQTISNMLFQTNPKGMTPITYSLKQAVQKDFLGFRGKKHIILLTDGGENCDESPCVYAMELIKMRKDIFIDVIAFNIDDEDALEQLQCAALVTSGKFYTANTAAELARSLHNSVNAKKQVEAKIMTNY